MNPDPGPAKKDDRDQPPPGSPSGPQPRGTDEAAGGADSSPHETASSDERRAKTDARMSGDQKTTPGGLPGQAP
jgi:hypothetical protein